MDYRQLSKVISYALRHQPGKFGLTLDEAGWVPVDDLLKALRARRQEWRELVRDDLLSMMRQANKQRYEIAGDKIRAIYGHSIAEKIQHTPETPPNLLYHGTSPDAAALILRDGLKPMARQYVHLSTDEKTAYLTGHRKAPQPVILVIQAGAAHRDGIAFYHGNEDVWLADLIPPQYIQPSQETSSI